MNYLNKIIIAIVITTIPFQLCRDSITLCQYFLQPKKCRNQTKRRNPNRCRTNSWRPSFTRLLHRASGKTRWWHHNRRSGHGLSHHGVTGNHDNGVCNTNSWPAHGNLAGRVRFIGDSGRWSIDGNWVMSALSKIWSKYKVIMYWNWHESLVLIYCLAHSLRSLVLHVGGFC